MLRMVLRLMSVPFKSSADRIFLDRIFLDELLGDRTAILRIAWSFLVVVVGGLPGFLGGGVSPVFPNLTIAL